MSEELKNGVCLLNDSFPPAIDGVANAVKNYARVINNGLGEAVVVTPEWPGYDDSVFDYPVIRYPSMDTRKMMGYVTGMPMTPRILRQLQEHPVRVLHAHCPTVSLILARELREVLNVPIVFTYHTKFDIDIRRALKGKLIQDSVIKAMVENISACDEVWVVSEGAGENLRSLGYKGDYIVMDNGVDIPRGRVSEEKIRETVAGYDLPEGVPVFLFVGRMLWYKGQRMILEALEGLKSQNVDFRMVFIGNGGNFEEIKELAHTLELDDKVFFTGAIHDRDAIRAWYCRSDAFLFPSTYDTNGLVVREAAACGVASVLVKNSCPSEGVTDNVNGFLISETTASLAVMLHELCLHPEKMKEVGENAKRDLYTSWDTAVERAYARYQVVIDKYHAGNYEHKKNFQSEMLKGVGELSETFNSFHSGIYGIGSDIRSNMNELRSDMRSNMEDIRSNVSEFGKDIKERLKENFKDFFDLFDGFYF